ncbi:MAG: NAD(P)H-dependent oxidoreductase subunit E [Candidatus Cloacimonadales bacterium]
MDKKIKIVVCCGTTCHLMGSSEILINKEEIESQFKDQVVISGSPCLGKCKEFAAAQAPYLLINDELICQANLDKVIDKIHQILAKTEE